MITTMDRSQIAVIIIDAQPLFFEWLNGPQEPVLSRLEQLLLMADWFQLPAIATFEHPIERKGTLHPRLESFFPVKGQKFVKKTFNCCAEPEILAALCKLPGRQIAVAGSETDVCILQSVHGLLKQGFEVFLLEDCLFTSEPHPRPALQRMYAAGAIPCTYKTFHYELLHSVGNNDRLKEFSKHSKNSFDKFVDPEQLPPWDCKYGN